MNAPLKHKPRHFLDICDHDSATLKAIRDSDYDVLRATPRPGKVDTLAMMARGYVKGR